MSLIKRAAAMLGGRELALAAGLGMLGGGAHLAWEPAGLLVPGAVLTAIAVFGVRKLG